MPFKPKEHANLGYVDIPYKNMLDQLCSAHKRPIKAELEVLIQQAAKAEQLDWQISNKVIDK